MNVKWGQTSVDVLFGTLRSVPFFCWCKKWGQTHGVKMGNDLELGDFKKEGTTSEETTSKEKQGQTLLMGVFVKWSFYLQKSEKTAKTPSTCKQSGRWYSSC